MTKTVKMFVDQSHVSAVKGSIWDLSNFLWLQKLKELLIEKCFTQLPQILADVRYASSTSYLLRMG